MAFFLSDKIAPAKLSDLRENNELKSYNNFNILSLVGCFYS